MKAALIPALSVILVCQLIGEGLALVTGLPLPGPVLGMALLLAGLQLSSTLRDRLRPVVEGILGNLSLLFVPAGVGAAGQLVTLGTKAAPILLAVAVSTLLAIAAGALAFALVARLTGDHAPVEPLAGKGDGK